MEGSTFLKRGQALNRIKPAHRYEEIEGWLRDLVISGKPGELIPSEVDIATKFDVSRMTARQAVLNLMREGLVDRRRGAGTFISTNPMHRREGVLLSFTEDMKRRGLRPTSILISAKKETSSPADAKALGLTSGEKVVVIHRIRLADGIPLALERVALIPECEAVLKVDLENASLHEALRAIKIAPYIASGWLSARVSTSAEAKQLKIPAGTPLLVENRVIDDEKGRPIEHTATSYASNRYVVDIKLNCAPSAIAPFNAAPMAPA